MRRPAGSLRTTRERFFVMTRVKDRLGKSVRLGLVLSIAGMIGASACGSDDGGAPTPSRGGRSGAGGTNNNDASAGTAGFGGTLGTSGSAGTLGAGGVSGTAGAAGASGTGGTGGSSGDASVCPGPSSVPVDGFP